MININLISPKQKEAIKLQQIYLNFKNLMIVILLVIIVISIILLLGRLLLQNNFTKVVNETSLVLSQQQGHNKKIKDINSQLELISKIQEHYLSWSDLFITVSQVTPKNISISSIQIKTKVVETTKKSTKKKKKTSTANQEKFSFAKLPDKIITISGFARTREDLLLFEDNLNTNILFKTVDLPFHSKLKQTNIDFSITAEINSEQLKTTK